MFLLKLLQQSAGTFDRSRHQLRKERYKQRIFQEILLCMNLFTIHIRSVSQCLKGVEGNTHRQQHVHMIYFRLSHYFCPGLQKEIGVLKVTQNSQIHRKTDKQTCPFQPNLFLFFCYLSGNQFHPQSATIGQYGGSQNQQGICGIPTHIKVIGTHQQPNVSNLMGNQKIQQCHYGEKNQKLYGIKQHILLPNPNCLHQDILTLLVYHKIRKRHRTLFYTS